MTADASQVCLWQMTALGQPKLLERVSASLVAIRDLFAIFDADLNGVVTRGEFDKVRCSYDAGRTRSKSGPKLCATCSCQVAADVADLRA